MSKYYFDSYILGSLLIWSLHFCSNQFGFHYFQLAANLVSIVKSQLFFHLHFLDNQTQKHKSNLKSSTPVNTHINSATKTNPNLDLEWLQIKSNRIK